MTTTEPPGTKQYPPYLTVPQVQELTQLSRGQVYRLIERYSNQGETVYDPFGGLGTVPLRALMHGRRGLSVELNAGYWLASVKDLEAEERAQAMPSLFD